MCEKNEAQKPIATELSKIQSSIRLICADLNPPGIDFEDFDCMILELCHDFERRTGILCECNLLARKTSDEGFILFVNDNGKGFDVNSIKFNNNSHFRLSGIKQRASIMDAKLQIESSEDDDTQFRLEI